MCYNTTSALLRSDLASPQITAHWGKNLTVVQEPCKHKCVPSYPQRRSRYAITQQHQSGCIHFAANSKDDYTWSSLRKHCSHLRKHDIHLFKVLVIRCGKWTRDGRVTLLLPLQCDHSSSAKDPYSLSTLTKAPHMLMLPLH